MNPTGIGARFEQAALAHLKRAGLKSLERNYRTRFGELDMVMRDGDTLVFVEVRYRRHPYFGGAAASVGAVKRKKLVLAAQGFLAAHPRFSGLPCRFDVVAFDGNAEAPTCQWQRNAFDAWESGP